MDGDTLKIADKAKGPTTIRLLGIDAPESQQKFADEAKRWLVERVLSKNVRAEVTSNDRYSRKLANLYIDGAWVNKEMVDAGLAWHYTGYSKDAALAESQERAQSQRIGLWKDDSRIAPWDFRNGVRQPTKAPVNVPSIRENDTVVYITEKGDKYHRAGCRFLEHSKQAIPLSRAQSAYSPCKVCNP